METAALVAPVTALEFLQDAFLLTGEGPVLTVYSLPPPPKACASLSVLQHYRIHGIRRRILPAFPPQSSAPETFEKKKDGLSSRTEPSFYDLAVFGGKAVRVVRLHDGERLRLEILGPLLELQDWALDVRWLSGEMRLCVAVAHNSALLLDVSTGIALAQQSCMEGCLLYSALLLVHKSWSDTVLVGGTVFNQLVLWKPGGGCNSDHKAPVERRLLGHSGVIFSITYLLEEGWLASASDDRSVRVWAVGALGGSGGKCGDLNPACLRVLFGHQARVFSVHLSPGRVFSAGEDGACLVWDWAGGGTVVRTLKGHRAGGVRALAVSEGTATQERWVATGGANAGVRLWQVVESLDRKETQEEAVTEKLTDLKFSGQGVPKAVCIAEDHENTYWSQFKCVVCTDRGVVYQYRDKQWEMVWQGPAEFQSYCVMESITISVKNSTAKVDLCAVGNLSGSIQVFQLSHPQSGILLKAGSGKIHSLIWQEGDKKDMHLLASGAEGLTYHWFVEVKLNKNSSLALSVKPLPPFLLPPCAKRWLTAAVRLPSTSQGMLWVCGDRRGSLLLFQEEDHLEPNWEDESDGKQTEENGDRNSETKDRKDMHDVKLQPLSCLLGVHGKQGVTSVYEHQGLLYSTGRDGFVRVFKVKQTATGKPEGSGKDGLQLVVLRVLRACKGMEWLERVLILKSENPEEEMEGELKEVTMEAKQMEKKGREARFVILGFHATNFVVWDPVKQERLLAVPCGGGHRSWSLWPFRQGYWSGYGALVFIKQGTVMASQSPGESSSWDVLARTGGWELREGIHGRGIGCVCRLGTVRATKNETQTKGIVGRDEVRAVDIEEGQWEIVATGGEDTSLTVLAVNSNSGNIKVLSVITDHISGIRTMAVVTAHERECENQLLSALLVSASGRAQMHCYRLSIGWDNQRLVPSCQVVQVASHRLDEHWERKRNRHKMVKMDPETRYMSVAVVEEKTDLTLLALGCSDGAVRLFSISETNRQIDLLWETFYHQRCVLSVATCILEDGKGNRYRLLFSAATDGKIVLWDLTETPSLLSTGTQSRAPSPPIPSLDVPAHQSGVNSLAVRVEKQGHQDGGCLVTVASGGDDGQLTVSRIRVKYPENGTFGSSRGLQSQHQGLLHLSVHSQLYVPLAHAAPLTALRLLRPGLMVTTSSDQRVCLWRVCNTNVSLREVLCSHIADAAGLAVWEGWVKGEEDEERKTGFESKQEVAIWGGRESLTRLVRRSKTGGSFSKERETGDKPVEAVSKTDDPIYRIRDEKTDETGSECNQTEAVSQDQAEREVNTDTGSKTSSERRKSRGKTGWVLVCGQGFQLLRVRNTETDEQMWTEERTREGGGESKE
ncbi:tRNA (34-2'-O)-methyltransferase regulator WDR6 [Aulostomus maculatus]